MARPIKEGMHYFPHDVNAAGDKKIEALRSLYGNDGYAFYFIMLEQIYQEPDFEIDVSDAETKEEIFQILAKKTAVTIEKFLQMFSTALKWGCFDKNAYEERGIITSKGIKKRANVVVEKRIRMRQKYQQNRNSISDAETPPKTPQSKVKKSKEKDNIPSIVPPDSKPAKHLHGEFVELTSDEYKRLLDEFGEQDLSWMINRLNIYLGQNAKNRKKYTSHNHVLRGWVKEKLMEEKEKQKNRASPANSSKKNNWNNWEGLNYDKGW